MSGTYWKLVNDVIFKSDVILLILDARMPESTVNPEIVNKVKAKGKKLIYVLNKCDLIEKSVSEKLKGKFQPSVFISAKKHYGGTILRSKIMSMTKGEKCVVGVLGYPNVGKSSIINMLKGKGATGVAPISGYTKALQKVKASNKIMLYDTPGVIPYREKDDYKQSIIGTINFDMVKDPEGVVSEIMMASPGIVEKYYDVEPREDPLETLERIAIKKNRVLKGGKADTLTVSRMILKDWQFGKIEIK
jgi:ribosome biogenesis GTPase A